MKRGELIDDYESLFLQQRACIDTRSPGEFKKGHFPNAVNLPLMTNQERALVGTCYKQKGQDAAIALGHRLVSGELREARIASWLAFTHQHPDGALFCWRGGLRSQTCQQWLADAGVSLPRVKGGYKAMRRFLIDSLESICRQKNSFILLAGHTGAAKTDLLLSVKNSVDLEGLANHRGSAFGRKYGGQPAQTSFENALAIDLLNANRQQPDTPIILEDESHLIGRCSLPLALETAMKNSPLIFVQTSLEQRVEHSFKNYILDNLQQSQQRLGEQAGFDYFANDLRESLGRIKKRLGGARYTELLKILEAAILNHQAGDNSRHREWIEILLRDYYDPMYNYQLDKKKDRIMYRGPASEVLDYLRA